MVFAKSFHYKLLSLAVGAGLSLFPAPVKTYEPGRIEGHSIKYNTHSLLTKKTVELWNQQHSGQFLDLEEVVKGTIEEDSETGCFIRAFNHFCDFQTKQGLPGFLCSLDWARNQTAQAGDILPSTVADLCSAESTPVVTNETVAYLQDCCQRISEDYNNKYPFGDRTWNKAIQEKDQRVLGHILHLIQDLTVPAHSRNDVHPPWNIPYFHADSYEVWAESEAPEKIFLLDLSAVTVKEYGSLEEIFAEVNSFTGKNFFSDDTVGKYSSPDVKALFTKKEECPFLQSLVGTCTYYGTILNGREIPLLRKAFLFNYTHDQRALQEYWKILGKKAIEAGLAIIDLYFREIEKQSPDGGTTPENCFTTGCSESGCLFYDSFGGSALDTACRWTIDYGNAFVSNNELHVPGYSRLTAKFTTPLCSTTIVETKMKRIGLGIAGFPIIPEVVGFVLLNDGTVNAYCAGPTPGALPGVNNQAWNSYRLEIRSNGVGVYVNDILKQTLPCSPSGLAEMQIYTVPSALDNADELLVDYVKIRCEE